MLGSWFLSKSSDSVNKDGGSVQSPSPTDAVRNDEQRPSQTAPTAQPLTFSTPHDDIIAGILGVRQVKDKDASADENVLKNDDGKEQASPTEHPPQAGGAGHRTGIAGTSESFKLPQQELRDPFTGALLGTLIPSTEEGDGDGDIDIDAKEADLWAHHAKILQLQTELAQMHLEMESIGAKSDEKAAKGTSHRWGQSEGDGGEDDVGVDDQAKAKKAREKEFESLPGKFTGREAAIDGIMNKLGDLSSAVTAFHALQMPRLDPGRSNNPNVKGKTIPADKIPPTSPISPPQQPKDVPIITTSPPTDTMPPVA